LTAWSKPRWGVLAVALVGAVAVVLAVVSAQRSSSAGSSDPASGGGSSDRVAPLRLATIDGKALALPRRRPGMVMFSTSGCLTCFVAAEHMAEFRADASRPVDAAFVSIAPGDSAQALADRQASIRPRPFPFAIDQTGTLAQQYRIAALGTVVVYDAAGRIVARVIEPSLGDLPSAFGRAGVV
jgi:hypothetical protein